MEEVAEANNYLALQNDNGEYYLNGNWFIQWSGDYEIAGTTVTYQRHRNKEMFKASGPLKESLHIMVSNGRVIIIIILILIFNFLKTHRIKYFHCPYTRFMYICELR